MFKFDEQVFVEKRGKSFSADYLNFRKCHIDEKEKTSPRSFTCDGETIQEAIKSLKRCVEGNLLVEVDTSLIEGALFIDDVGMFRVDVVKISYSGKFEASVTI